jgi:hypothetical membrane protein
MKKNMIVPLWAGVAVPFIYIVTIIVASLFYPGYSHWRQFASELGAARSPHPWIFNIGLGLTGLAEVFAAYGFLRAFQRLSTFPGVAWVAAMIIAVSGLSALMSAHFPLPDHRHSAYGIGTVDLGGPLVFAIAVWKLTGAKHLRWFLIINNVVLIFVFVIFMGWGGIANRQNFGIIQRIGILASFPWIGIAAYFLLKHFEKTPPNTALEPTGTAPVSSGRWIFRSRSRGRFISGSRQPDAWGFMSADARRLAGQFLQCLSFYFAHAGIFSRSCVAGSCQAAHGPKVSFRLPHFVPAHQCLAGFRCLVPDRLYPVRFAYRQLCHTPRHKLLLDCP